MSELAKALAAFQAELPAVKKGNTADVPTKTGGKYSYQYADLTDITEAAMPLLSKHGLSFTSRPTMTENGFVLAYRLLHTSGEADLGEYPLPDPAHNPAQTIGSAITYARRYAMCAATGIAPGGDDDDAKDVPAAAPRQTPTQRLTEQRDNSTIAINGAGKATTPEELDKIEDWAGKAGLTANKAVVGAIATARARVGASVTDAWAVAPVPE